MTRRSLLFCLVFALPALPLGAQQPAGGCDPGNAGLILPTSFCARLVADSLPANVRHFVIRENGDIFIGSRGQGPTGLYALRDADGDGRYEVRERIWDVAGTGVAIRGEYLWFGTNETILRFRIPTGQLRPDGPPDTIVTGLPAGGHGEKAIELGRGDTLFVNIGSLTNNCEVDGRAPGSAGVAPCVELATRAGVWRFSASRPRQTQQDGVRHATGQRNMVALTLHPQTGELYGVQHGRDRLFQNWPQLFNEATSAELPSEELHRIRAGDDFGWPYCFHDRFRGFKVLAPEYGGDGATPGRCADVTPALIGYPGHWGPNDILFYDGVQFPEQFRRGAFIAFHGSWNRAPLPQGGFNVVFQPFDEEGRPTSSWSIFADGFRAAGARPTGLAIGPDGALFISADTGRRIWRVQYNPQP